MSTHDPIEANWCISGTHPKGLVVISDGQNDVLERVDPELACEILYLRRQTLERQRVQREDDREACRSAGAKAGRARRGPWL